MWSCTVRWSLALNPVSVITVLCCLFLACLNYPPASARGFWGGIPFLCCVSGGTLYTRLPVTDSGFPAILNSFTAPCPLQRRKRKVWLKCKEENPQRWNLVSSTHILTPVPGHSPSRSATGPTVTSEEVEEIKSFTHPVASPHVLGKNRSLGPPTATTARAAAPGAPAPPPPDSSGAGAAAERKWLWRRGGPPPWCGGGGSCSQQIRVGPKALFHLKWWNRQGYRKGQRKM